MVCVASLPLALSLESMRLGDRVGSPRTGRPEGHEGWDLRATLATLVTAPLAGDVVEAHAYDPAHPHDHPYAGYGNAIVLRHSGPYGSIWSLYAHLSQLLARRGDRVVSGQVIGHAGSTGTSTGVHLHHAWADRPWPKLYGAGRIDPTRIYEPMGLLVRGSRFVVREGSPIALCLASADRVRPASIVYAPASSSPAPSRAPSSAPSRPAAPTSRTATGATGRAGDALWIAAAILMASR